MTSRTHDDPARVPQLVLSGRWTPPGDLLTSIWRSRELCWTLARKDFFVRYRRAVFGALWAVSLPAVQAVVLSVVLSRVTKISVPHYSVFIFSGVVGWSYFSTCIAAGATSIVDNATMSSKIYFPRAILPIAICISGLFTLTISAIVLLVVEIVDGAGIGLHVFLLVPALLLVGALTSALSLALSAAHVYLRDIKYAVQTGLLLWFYMTPVFYPLQLLHGVLKIVVLANPMTGVTQLFHFAAVGTAADLVPAVLITGGWTIAITLVGLWLHCRFDRFVADLL